MSILRHLRAITLLPFMATVVIPGLIVFFFRTMYLGWGLPPVLWVLPFLFGALLICLGLGLFGWTVLLFADVGQGTLAPWDPTQHLVVRGPYQHVRNPMISGVLAILLGEAALLGSLPVFCWFLLFFALNQLYIPRFEEPGLEERFGEEYRRYKQHVPRWIPRPGPWRAH
jgi:protein-S-isoprenylcysteine O-methyltransferase Ste14